MREAKRLREYSMTPEEILAASRLNLTEKLFGLKAHQAGVLSSEQLSDERLIRDEKVVNEVAHHESGHVMVASVCGGEVLEQSVVPQGRVRGFVRVAFWTGSIENRVKKIMATLAGGWVGEEASGKTDHSGTGADMAHLNTMAGYASKFLYEGRISAQQLISEAFSTARSIIYSRMNSLEASSFTLHLKRAM